MKVTIIKKITIVLFITSIIGACGTKPRDVSYPVSEQSKFPRTYPNPNTDMK